MKWNILIASLVMSVGLCANSYGFGLLDQMLGASGCGCASSCCDYKPACGCEVAPACGCEAAPSCNGAHQCCKPKCCRKPLISCCKPKCCKPACDHAAAPACGCEAKPKCCNSGCCGGLGILDCLFSRHGCCHKSHGCAAKPACGCEAAPSCGCAPKPKCCKSSCCAGLGILDILFGGHGCGCQSSCCKPACGCEVSCGVGAPAPAAGDAGGDMAPMPPAPVIDPSAFVPSPQNVVKASTNVVR